MMMSMTEMDPFQGLGPALALLRKRAGFATQTEASEVLKIDKGQLSRWENENPRPTLDNLGRALAGYGATLGDLVAAMAAMAASVAPRTSMEDQDPTVREQIRSLTEAVRQLEERQAEIESRIERLEQESL